MLTEKVKAYDSYSSKTPNVSDQCVHFRQLTAELHIGQSQKIPAGDVNCTTRLTGAS